MQFSDSCISHAAAQVADSCVTRINTTDFSVQSQSRISEWHAVKHDADASSWSCSCPAFQMQTSSDTRLGLMCQHIHATHRKYGITAEPPPTAALRSPVPVELAPSTSAPNDCQPKHSIADVQALAQRYVQLCMEKGSEFCDIAVGCLQHTTASLEQQASARQAAHFIRVNDRGGNISARQLGCVDFIMKTSKERSKPEEGAANPFVSANHSSKKKLKPAPVAARRTAAGNEASPPSLLPLTLMAAQIPWATAVIIAAAPTPDAAMEPNPQPVPSAPDTGLQQAPAAVDVALKSRSGRIRKPSAKLL